MKTNLFNILLAVELSLGIVVYTNAAEAGLHMNNNSLTGQVSRPTSQDQSQPRTKALTLNGSSLSGKKTQSK